MAKTRKNITSQSMQSISIS